MTNVSQYLVSDFFLLRISLLRWGEGGKDEVGGDEEVEMFADAEKKISYIWKILFLRILAQGHSYVDHILLLLFKKSLLMFDFPDSFW